MKFKIGFSTGSHEPEEASVLHTSAPESHRPIKSVVQIHFPARNRTLSYFNDRFDLHCGDTVFVGGKLEGVRGRVVDVAYNFKIKLSDYQRVIAVADTHLTGTFHIAGAHFVSFDGCTMPYGKIRSWFKPPVKEDDRYITGRDGSSFRLEHLGGMGVSHAVGERGHDYYISNKVAYLCLDGQYGKAIVEGSEPYELEFEYKNGEISHLTCSCVCSYPCKHEVAAMLQLQETLELIDENYAAQYERSHFFAAVSKGAFISFVMDGRETGSFTLNGEVPHGKSL